MKIDPKLIEKAKEDLARMQREQGLSNEDRELLKRYPKHTLAAAKLIDSAQAPRPPLDGHVLHDCGEDFKYLQWQESGTPYSRQ